MHVKKINTTCKKELGDRIRKTGYKMCYMDKGKGRNWIDHCTKFKRKTRRRYT